MKLIVCLLVFCNILFGCKKNELPTEQISNISVVREMSSSNNVPQASLNNVVTPTSTYQHSKARYHIIVASHGLKEKNKAESFVAKLKALGYPASILYSSGRYRVSIESFPSEAESKAARDEYSTAVNRKDLWIHKVD